MNNETTGKTALPCFKLKGSSFAITTLQLLDNNLDQLASQVAGHVSKAPKFFDHTPIIIDCQIITDKPGSLDLNYLLQTLKSYNIIPIGLRGGRLEHHQQAIAAGIAIFPLTKNNNHETEQPIPTEPEQAAPEPKVGPSTKLINHPIRSGQQVYAKGGDLVVIGAVSAGAECLADGNIHIYGPLRGRALAGVHGDNNAHIFCTHLEAELVSIAGQYQVSETLKEGIWQSTANIFLQDDSLQIVSL